MQLRGVEPDKLVFVGAGSPEEAERLRSQLGSPHRFVCDPERKLFHAFGLIEAGGMQLLGPSVLLGGLRAALKGHLLQAPPTNPRQLGGAFVLDASGKVLWAHRARHAADNASARTLQNELRKAQKMRER